MKVLAVLAALMVSTATPNVNKLVLQPTQVGSGYQLYARPDGIGVHNTVTLDLCGRKNYPSEKLRTTRLQVNYAAKGNDLGLSNEVVTYKAGGAEQAMREVTEHATHCPTTPIVTGEAGVPPLRFTITRLSDSKLLKGYLAVKIRVRGTVKVNGKAQKVDQTSYAVYQRFGSVLSGTYSYGPNTPSQLAFELHAAEQSAQNLRRGHNVGSPTA
jgi:hypothetical protein